MSVFATPFGDFVNFNTEPLFTISLGLMGTLANQKRFCSLAVDTIH